MWEKGLANPLEMQCEGAWYLDREGMFHWLSQERAETRLVADVAEMIGTLLLLHMESGGEARLKIGPGLLVARVDRDGIRMAWKSRKGNPLVMSSLLRKVGLEKKAAPAGFPVIADLGGETLEAETVAGEESNQSAGDEVWSRQDMAARVISLRNTEGRHVESVSLGGEDSEGLSFQIEYELPPEEPVSSMPAGTRREASRREPASQREDRSMTWMDFGRMVDNITELATRYVGERVVRNYWRRALEGSEEPLLGLVGYDSQEGICFLELDAVVDRVEATEMLAVIDRWLLRCERVVPEEARIWRRMVGQELNGFWMETKEL